MQLYAITDRRRPSAQDKVQPAEAVLRRRLVDLAVSWAMGSVHFIQLREKDLDPAALVSLAQEVRFKLGEQPTKLLVNVPAASAPESASLALAAGAAGVHLSGKPKPGASDGVRKAFRSRGLEAVISMPCHSLEDIDVARKEQVDLVLFSPVFEKLSGDLGDQELSLSQGLEGLRQACAVAQGIPVFALGGITSANAPDCLAAGAAGVAGIRLFAGDDWRQLLPEERPAN